MTLAAIIPWRDQPERVAACQLIAEHLVEHLAPALSAVGLADTDGEHFNRGRALNAGVRTCEADVLVFCDADLWVPGVLLRTAVDFAQRLSFVVPFTEVAYLTEAATAQVLAGQLSPLDAGFDETCIELLWDRLSTGGCNVLTRAAFEQAGGFDERFAGWGYEDAAFETAATLLVGPPEWLSGRAVHLWHPSDPTRGTPLQEEGLALCLRYQQAAALGAEALRALQAEQR